MNYPSREQVNLLIEYCEMNDMTLIKKGCLDALSMHDEIDRLTALVPKVVVPSSDDDTDFYACDCGEEVAIVGNWSYKYCPACGASMDWDKVEVES